MKTLKENFFGNLGIGKKANIEEWLKKYCIISGNYAINNDMTINVNGSVKIKEYHGKELPDFIQFNIVSLTFFIQDLEIITLRGCPKDCEAIICKGCKQLKNLEHLPLNCEYLNCSGCTNLKSLKGIPKTCIRIFCENCDGLKNLKGLPNIKMNKINCSGCKNLTSLEGAPKKCDDFDCSGCESLMSLEYCPNYVLFLNCQDCGGKFTKGYLIRNKIYAHRCDADKE